MNRAASCRAHQLSHSQVVERKSPTITTSLQSKRSSLQVHTQPSLIFLSGTRLARRKHGVSGHPVLPPSLPLPLPIICASSSPGNLDELHLHPCSPRLCSHSASRSICSNQSLVFVIYINRLPSPLSPSLAKTCQTTCRSAPKAGRLRSKPLAAGALLVLARTLLSGAACVNFLARATRAVWSFPQRLRDINLERKRDPCAALPGGYRDSPGGLHRSPHVLTSRSLITLLLTIFAAYSCGLATTATVTCEECICSLAVRVLTLLLLLSWQSSLFLARQPMSFINPACMCICTPAY